MKLPRRNFLHLAAGAAALPAVSRMAWAQAYPTRPVRLILGYGAGGAPDTIARIIGQSLWKRLGQPVIIENRPGAGSNIGTEVVVRATSDGHTLLYVTTANATNATLYQNLNFDFLRDIAPAAGIVRVPNIITVNPSVPVKTIPQLVAYARDNPGKLNFGAAAGTVQLAGELFKMVAGIDIVRVPYRSQAQAVTDLISGQMQVGFDVMPAVINYVRGGQLRALAVTTAMRSDVLPDTPTAAQFLAGYEASTWHGVGVPKGTPGAIIEKINEGVNAALADPQIRARLANLGSAPMPMTPTEFGKLIAEETVKWGEVIRTANIRPEDAG